MNVEDALEQFLVQVDADGRSPHTRAQYARHILLLAAWIREAKDGIAVEGIDHRLVARFLASPAVQRRADGQPRKAGSANALRSSLRCFFGYLHQAGVLSTNPARLVRRARVGAPVPRAITLADQGRLLATIEAASTDEARRDALLVELMLGTGLRLGSALALDVQDVDLERGEIHVRQLKCGGEKTVFLGEALRARLAACLTGRLSGPLFGCAEGRRLGHRQAQRRIAQWLARAEIGGRYSAHSLRHAFAMGLLARTNDVLLVKEALGHSSVSSTLVYCRADRDRLRAVMAG